jgi:pimeloyl-ACP methyl ester carboxylesterase
MVGLLAMSCCALTGVGVAPDEPGMLATAEYQVELEDAERGRSMDLLVVYPISEDDASCAPFPLVVFNHGFMLSGEAYRSYGEHLASHGFVVALPTYPMSFFNVHHAKLAEDVRFVIDTCLGFAQQEGHPLFGILDPVRIGTSGHSLGGKLSLLEAVTDERILAAALLDPVDSGNPLIKDLERYPSVTPELMPELDISLLLIGAELGSKLVIFSPCAPEDENYQRYFEAANPPAIEVTQLDVGHAQYVDEGYEGGASSCAVGDVPDAQVRAASAAYLTAFFQGTLYADPATMDWLDARLAEDEAEGRITVRRKSKNR